MPSRREANSNFNQANRWRKRGLAMVPIKYGVSIANNPMPASVRIYADDGTVHVSHGGCEIGQGIHVKVAAAVAHTLECPLEAVCVGDTSSLENPNGSDTGGSIGSETCVAAALDACAALSATLAPFKKANPGASWQEVIRAASDASAPLSAVGWYQYSNDTDKFDYATQGVCCSEVEIDVLTGEMQIIRVDLTMDQGTPLNPLVDLGQAEGGFVMALGHFLTEEVIVAPDGSQLSLGTWEYKPPAVHDLPLEWNVSFEQNSPNPWKGSVMRSKASGEPPMALGVSVVLAVRDAVRAARAEAGLTDLQTNLELPLTVERIQLACGVTAHQFKLR